jgi:hypothetical protein
LRDWFLTLAVCACSKDAPAPPRAQTDPGERSLPPVADGSGAVAPRAYPDLAAALVATIPADARVIGFGEIHARRDRPAATSTLAAFTRALPALAGRLSDLVIETWVVDPGCGAPAVDATARIEAAVERPAQTRSEIARLTDAARAARVQPHAMTLHCADYAAVAPAAAMLTLTTGELRRIVTSAVAHRDAEPGHRPWIAVYGGALHNNRLPDAGVAEWSYAADADRATGGRFVEIDLVVPELAAASPAARREPWFALAGAPRDPALPVLVWTRGERSFVVILPPASSAPAPPAPAPPAPAPAPAPPPGARGR